MTVQTLIACIQVNFLKTPLLRVQTAQDCLSTTRDEVTAMIEDGRLPFAFDLALCPGTRKEPRIFTLCVAEMSGWKNPIGQTKNLKLPEVVELIIPKRDVRSTELKRILAVGHQHIYQLAKKHFKIVRKPAMKDGPDSYTVFSRTSIARFLDRRRIL
jgi:hypothetical protein